MKGAAESMEYKEIDERASREHSIPNDNGPQFLTELSVIDNIPWVLPERPPAQQIFTGDRRFGIPQTTARQV